ncbi:S8 family peptidase [Microbacterium radiodurans]|uniref:S8 family serine peptidase n=1 Tax=Microbacterium radiodurans TaxID=661398 RepID=A0A5J5IN85_9MICO|nr:S8 family serine peptidase [Microbacterium radiodurans]KAA9084133.1 S8 family serine peptidase [Microbacterium radiodurans]
MNHRTTRMLRVGAAAALLPCLAISTTALSAAAETTLTLDGLAYDAPLSPEGSIAASLAKLSGTTAVFVAFDEESALDVALDATGKATADNPRVEAQVDEIDERADEAAAVVEAEDAETEVLYVSRYTVPGVALQADAEALATLADLPGVTSVSPIVLRTIDEPQATDPANAASDAFVQALQVWQQTGRSGEGVNVAVIDTGLDYTHADFGGPGTVEAYAAALSSTNAPGSDLADPAKYLGGFDFAGPTYNADSSVPTYDPFPVPDDNPIDGPGGGHGTHVAGTAVGYGVLDGGATFTGDAASLDETALQNFEVGPGAAPASGLFALKVFGDNGGSTALTGAALDWVGEQIANGVDIDVVNLSLGSDFGAPDDPESAKVNALIDVGVLPVLAAGNAGDVTDIAGAPGNAARALAVAATSSGNVVQSGFSVDAPANLAGAHPGQYSEGVRSATATGSVAAPLAVGAADGCTAFSESDRQRLAGKIAWLEWDEANLACGSATRFGNASDAGAIGVLLTSTVDVFEGGIAGNDFTPGLQMTRTVTQTLRPALEGGTLVVSLDPAREGEFTLDRPELADTIASFTSRGLHGSYNDVVKPDVAAPGVSIVSAGKGKGTGPAILSGTSMASPLVAGVAALVAEAHPEWTPAQIKTGIMNTAAHDITTGGPDGIAYGPTRVGGGRVDALDAVENQVLVSSDENAGLVTGSFGVIEVGDAPITQTRPFTAVNNGTQDRTFDLAYLARSEMPGASYTLDRDSITVPAGGSAAFTVTLSIADPAALRRSIEPTMSRTQSQVPRQFVADASGVVQLTPRAADQSPLRVAVFAAPKPTSATTVSAASFAHDALDGSITIGGRGVEQGTGGERFASLMAPFQLGIEDPDDTFPDTSAATTLNSVDIRAVGVSSTAPQLTDPSQGVLSFGIQMDGDWNRLAPFNPVTVDFDVNADELIDFSTTYTVDRSVDQPFAVTYDASSQGVVDRRPLNGFDGSVDTNQFDNNVLVLPVSLKALGYTPDTTDPTITYRVRTESFYSLGNSEEPRSFLVDDTASATFDVFRPAVWFGETGQTGFGTAIFADRAGVLAAHRDSVDQEAARILVLHLHGQNGNRASVSAIAEAATPGAGEPSTPPVPSPGIEQPAPGIGAGTPGAGASRGSHGPLASTGGAVPLTAAVAAILLAAAGGALLVMRRRRSAAEAAAAPTGDAPGV